MIKKAMIHTAYLTSGKAIAFFVGTPQEEKNRYRDYIRKLTFLIDHLEYLDSKSKFGYWLTVFSPHSRRESEDLRHFIKENKQIVALLKDKIELLKEKERNVLSRENSVKNLSSQI
jgi:hypothetical protein